jgi:hypothetical protein
MIICVREWFSWVCEEGYGRMAKQLTDQRKVGRRALLGVAAATVVGVGAGSAITPELESMLIERGRQAAFNELKILAEDVTIDEALKVAQWTRAAVLYIVRPLASLVATGGSDALSGLISAISNSEDALGHLAIHIGQLDQLKTLLTTWRDNLNQLPITLQAYVNADADSAAKYLTALKQKIDGQPVL